MGRKPIVLLVDDEPSLLSALKRALRREPIEIETADGATKALARLEASPPIALVISDHKMPGMSGTEMLARARKISPATARMLLSGWTSEIPQSEIAAAGLAAIHTKPWDDAALKESIRDALSD